MGHSPDLVRTTAGAVADIVSAPLLPQAKVNKALIALVQKKLVTKTVSGVSIYLLSTLRCIELTLLSGRGSLYTSCHRLMRCIVKGNRHGDCCTANRNPAAFEASNTRLGFERLRRLPLQPISLSSPRLGDARHERRGRW